MVAQPEQPELVQDQAAGGLKDPRRISRVPTEAVEGPRRLSTEG